MIHRKPAVLTLLGPAALAPWIGRTPPDTLGALLRAALGTGEGGLVALYDALAASNTPAARALLARILGAPFLLVTVRVRQGALVGADARACTDEREALGLLAALGAHEPGRGALTRGMVIGGPASGDPVALLPDDDASVLAGGATEVGDGDALLALPLLDLDVGSDVEAAPASVDRPEPQTLPAAAWPGLVGGAAGASASPFLEAFDPRLRDEEADASPSGGDDEDASTEEGPDGDADDETGSEADDGGDDAADDEDLDDGGASSPFLAETLGGAPLPSERRVDAAPVAEPQPQDAEVNAAALARLSARAAAAVERVTASVATDDGVLDTVVDIVPWLADASEQELRALVTDRWRGEEAAELARALAEEDPEVEEVVRQARRMEAELVVEIDATAAAAWLAQHRPALAERLGLLPDD